MAHCTYTYGGKTYEAHEFDDLLRALPADVAAKYMPGVKAVPRAPFIDKTDAWLSLALKRVVKLAADEGYDKVAFVNGAQSAERYSLAKQVESIRWSSVGDSRTVGLKLLGGHGTESFTVNGKGIVEDASPTLEGKPLEDVVGKAVAEKILGSADGRLAGDGLKIGGEGMVKFYDSLVPMALNKLLPKLGGGKAGRVEVSHPVVKYERTARYVGPAHTYQDVARLYELSKHHRGDIYDNPLTGVREPYPINRVSNEQDLRVLTEQMRKGKTFAEAMVHPEIAGGVAELFGGKIERFEPAPETQPHVGFDVTPAMREKAAEGMPLFKAGDKQAPAMQEPATPKRVAELQQQVDAITAKWDKAPPVTVVASAQSPAVPQAIRDAEKAARDNGGGVGRAVFYKGEVWIFADGVRTATELATYLYHEVLGHAGLRGHYGRELNNLLDQVAMYRRADVTRMIERTGMTGPRVQQRAAEEVLAYLAQTKPDLPLVKRAIAAIRSFLREHVPGFKNLAMTDDELIRKFILPARRFIEGKGGKMQPVEGDTAFSQGHGFHTREIQVDGVWRPIETSSGELIHPKVQGQQLYWRRFADAFPLDDKGRPQASGADTAALVDGTGEPIAFARGPMNDANGPLQPSGVDVLVDRGNAYAQLLGDADARAALSPQERNFLAAFGNLLVREGVKPAISKSLPESAARDAKFLGDVVERPTFRDQGYRGLDAPTQRAVLLRVGGLVQNLQILRAVVGAVPVDVMHVLTGKQGAPEHARGNEAVLPDLSARNADDAIAAVINVTARVAKDAKALKAAEKAPMLGGGNLAGVAQNRRAANGAGEGGGGGQGFSTGGNLFEPYPGGGWEMPQDSRTDRFIREMADSRVDLRRVQQAITAAGREIDQRFDARQAETLYPGRVDRRTKAFLAVEARPLIDAMARAKASLTELSDYLIARHAPDRNALIAQRNPDLPDGGAGTNSAGQLMTTAAARDYIAAIPAERRAQLEELARYVDGITKGTRELLVREGLEKRSTIDGWERALGSKYVPLFKEERESGNAHPIGSGFSVRGGASKATTGSTAQVQNVLAHVLEQREAAITRAEKNRVAMRLYGLALSNPNREFWTTIKPGMTNEAIGHELTAMGVNIDDAVAGMQRTPTIRSLDPVTGTVVDRPNPVYKNLLGALSVRVNGEDRVLLLNIENERAKRMAEALKNLDGLTRLDQATSIAASVGRAMASGTRWIASVNTQYNPVFGLRNIFRDVWGGIVNLGSTPLRGHSWQVLRQLPAAMAGITASIAHDEGSDKAWARLWEQFQNDGGRTGWRDSFKDNNERTKAIEAELKALAHAGRLTPRALASRMLHLLDHFNVVLENAVRLSAYKAALDMGLSRDRAAVIGRELTVDFNRKGRLGRELNPIYAFFNASVQGAARHVETLNGPTGKYVLAGGLLLGALQVLALAMGGYDDDELTDFDLARAFIVPMGKDADGKKRHLKLPYPIGLNILPNTGRVLTQLLLNGGKNGVAQVAQAVGNIFEALSPLGGSDLLDKDGHATAHGALTLVSPTVFDPLVDLATNRNFAGAPIEREARNAQDNRPGFQRVREGTQRSATGEAYMGVAQVINRMTGGSPYEPGYVSPTPERLRYIAETIGGGVVRELEKVVDSTDRAVRGEPQKGTNLPAVSGFYGEVDNQQVQQSRYFDNSRTIDQTQASIKAATKAGDRAELEKLYARPEAAMGPAQDRIQQRLTVLNKLAAATISDREKMREIDKAREQTMQQLNDAILAKERETPTLGDKLKKALAPAPAN